MSLFKFVNFLYLVLQPSNNDPVKLKINKVAIWIRLIQVKIIYENNVFPLNIFMNIPI